MNCCNNQDAITIVRGNDTDFNGQHLLTLRISSGVLDLSDLSATFTLVDVQKTFEDLSSGEIVIDYSASETAEFPLGIIYGDLNVISKTGKIATIENRLAFNVISVVHGNAIAVNPYEYNINVEQGGENILNVSVEAGVSVEVGTTTTLPAGSDATVENVGTPNHLVLNFGIPQGIQGEQGEQGEKGDPALINGHNAIVLSAGTGIAIQDNSGNIVISNTQTSAEWGNIQGPIQAQVDLWNYLSQIGVLSNLSTTAKTDLVNAINEVYGIANTALQPSDIINTTSSTAIDKALSANMGKSLQDQIDNLSARGRFLALWNCATGLAQSNPPESPYTYKTGDYFIVGTVATGSGTNYRPNGATYTTGVASTTVETAEVSVDDVYYYDGEHWRLQVNTQKTVAFVNIAGDPYDNTALAGALNEKQDELTAGTGIDISNDTVTNTGVRSVSTGSTNGTISVNTNGTSAEVAVKGLGSAAYTSSTDYATSAQGSKADSAVQPSDLGTAAYENSTSFATSAQGTKADSAIQGVQINSTDLTPDANNKVNIPVASNGGTWGVVKVNSNKGITESSGQIEIIKANNTELSAKTNNYRPVVPSNLDNAVMEGLGNNSLTWTDAYKTSARNTIGASSVSFVDWID